MARAERAARPKRSQHGRYNPERQAWRMMLRRCLSPRDKDFSRYGGRGITVCDRWRSDFAAFLSDMGPRPSGDHTLDRIDVNGNYEPANCRWATWAVQRANRRPSSEWKGGNPTGSIASKARALGIDPTTVFHRIRRGWTLDQALSTPAVRGGITA